MSTVELKSNMHALIDRIESDELLQSVYDFLLIKERSKPGKLWESLTEEQKKEVLLAYEESENEENIISRDEFFDSTP